MSQTQIYPDLLSVSIILVLFVRAVAASGLLSHSPSHSTPPVCVSFDETEPVRSLSHSLCHCKQT